MTQSRRNFSPASRLQSSLDRRTLLALVALLAFAHGLFFVWYLHPELDSWFSDQQGYRRLGLNLAVRAMFTKVSPDAPFVPEILRTPGYPLFLAAIYRVAGFNQVVVGVAQSLLIALLAILVYLFAAETVGRRAGVAAAAAVALYAPFAFYAALTMSDLLAVIIFVAAVYTLLRGLSSGRLGWYALAGGLFAYLVLVRPGWALFAPLFGAVWVISRRTWRCRLNAVRDFVVVGAVYLAVLAPWFAYTDTYFGAPALSGVNWLGRALWYGYWHGRFPSSEQVDLDVTVRLPLSDQEVQQRLAQSGGDIQGKMQYAQEWRSVYEKYLWEPGKLGTDAQPADLPRSQFLAADEEFRALALQHIRSDPSGYVLRRVLFEPVVLWVSEIPLRPSQAAAIPTVAVRAMWGFQLLLLVLAGLGVLATWRRSPLGALLFVFSVVYVCAVHLPIVNEPRYSLPAKPFVLLYAVVGAVVVARYSRALLPIRHREELHLGRRSV